MSLYIKKCSSRSIRHCVKFKGLVNRYKFAFIWTVCSLCACIHKSAQVRFDQTDSCMHCVFNALIDKSLSGQQGQGVGHLLCLPFWL